MTGEVIGDVDECREKFLEGIVCVCDETMEKYLDGQEIEVEKLHGCFTTAVASGSVVPILCCDNKKELGIEEIVDVISKYTPSPEKGLIRKYVEVEGDEVATEEKGVEVSKSAPFSAQVFKSITDSFVGKLSFFRIYSGTLEGHPEIYNARSKKTRKDWTHVQNFRKRTAGNQKCHTW